jgi:endonuclease/exonuclease/phosphatase family metal-dependent hydrolase
VPTPRRPALTRARLAVIALFALVAMLASPAVASATTVISGVRVFAVGHSWFTVTLDSLGSGWHYRLYASTDKTDVYYDNLAKAPYASASESSPTVSVTGLPYTSAPYWFRVQATSGTSHRTGDILFVGMRPTTPTSVAVGGSAHHGSWLTWSAPDAGGFQVQQATDAAFTTGVQTYSIRGAGHQFTPYGLTSGTAYYLRVRAANSGTYSGWPAAVRDVDASHDQNVRVGTYNVLEDRFDGTAEGDGTISPWSQRGPGAAAGIKSSGADVVAVEEAADWVGPQCAYREVGTRQVDNLVSLLGSPWAVAQTEVRPCLPGWARTGVYIIYNSAAYDAVGTAGSWNIGTSSYPRWAVYQELRNSATGAQFLFVSVHTVVGNTDALDSDRESETASMIANATKLAAGRGDVPIVYAGDYNSHELHPLDGPAVAMRAAHAADAYLVAQTMVNAQYNSANQYLRTPPAFGRSIDHVYAAPGVALRSFELVLKLTSGSFVGAIPSDHNLLVSDLTYPY